VFTVP